MSEEQGDKKFVDKDPEWDVVIDQTAYKTKVRYEGQDVDWIRAVNIHVCTEEVARMEIEVDAPFVKSLVRRENVTLTEKEYLCDMVTGLLKAGLITKEELLGKEAG